MNCPICGSAEQKTLYTLPMGTIAECRSCQTVFRVNLVTGNQIQELYDDSQYLDSTYFDRLKIGAERNVEPYLMYHLALERLEQKLPSKGRLLDVGCSYGAFLELARERGWDPYGVDVSTKAAAYAKEQRKLPITVGFVEKAGFPDDQFDVITLWDVIEHLDDPIKTLTELRRILKPGGILLIFTINQKSLINRVGHLIHLLSFGKVIAPLVSLYDIHHNFFFCFETLQRVLEKAGFHVVDTDWLEAMIDRWHTVRPSTLLMLGSDTLDIVSRVLGQKYRTIMYVSK